MVSYDLPRGQKDGRIDLGVVSVSERILDVAIVGAGFAGMYMLYRARGLGLAARVYEAGGGVGGTWYWNRYPGARCDVESVQYSYQFDAALQQEWDWSERYATQPEILRYAEHVVERFDLRRDIQFDTTIRSAHFDDERGLWLLATAAGEEICSRFVVMATGCLSSTNTPKFKGVERFSGRTFHTGRWPHEAIDFYGQRVAVVGTGSSAMQSIPLIAAEARHLYVFQRTPHYTVPARNTDYDDSYRAQIKANYPALRALAKTMPSGIDFHINTKSALEASEDERQREFQARWDYGGVTFMGAFNDLLLNPESNEAAARFVREKVREIVRDPHVAELLTPRIYIGCKRLCVDTNYWASFNRPNVSLVDVSQTPIDEITHNAVRVAGLDYEVDAIVFAIGFDAMTGALLNIDIRGTGGRSLRDKWQAGPLAYLGLGIAGFPNLFTITGPGSPSVLTNMLPSIEQHVEWISACIEHMRRNAYSRIEATDAAESEWVAHVAEVGGMSLRSQCNSWYVGANIPGKTRVFMPYIGGFPAYLEKCREVVANGYAGFTLS
jgi:cyclohexanone monooxygenase